VGRASATIDAGVQRDGDSCRLTAGCTSTRIRYRWGECTEVMPPVSRKGRVFGSAAAHHCNAAALSCLRAPATYFSTPLEYCDPGAIAQPFRPPFRPRLPFVP
jgi:hypothetical protein